MFFVLGFITMPLPTRGGGRAGMPSTPPQGASNQQSVAKGTSLVSPWALKVPHGPQASPHARDPEKAGVMEPY